MNTTTECVRKLPPVLLTFTEPQMQLGNVQLCGSRRRNRNVANARLDVVRGVQPANRSIDSDDPARSQLLHDELSCLLRFDPRGIDVELRRLRRLVG